MKTLIVEDSPTLCAIYEAYLDSTGLDVYTVGSFAEASKALKALRPQVVLLDVELPDGNGLDLIAAAHDMDPVPAVVVMTGNGMEYADDAMERGADDFLAKPFDASRLRVTLTNAAGKLELRQKLTHAMGSRRQLGRLQGSSAAMQLVYALIEQIASGKSNAFVFGEPGTGKSTVARLIHSLSERAQGPMIEVDCQSVFTDTYSSILFGEAPGVDGRMSDKDGVFQCASGGVVLLENVASLPMPAQRALLDVIETGTFAPVGARDRIKADVRLIASADHDPVVDLEQGALDEDLFYGLFAGPLRMPPLRERGADVAELATYFFQKFCSEEDQKTWTPGRDVLSALAHYYWPGNVSQLEEVVRALLSGCSSDKAAITLLAELGARPRKQKGFEAVD